jgi:hypothetical protein
LASPKLMAAWKPAPPNSFRYSAHVAFRQASDAVGGTNGTGDGGDGLYERVGVIADWKAWRQEWGFRRLGAAESRRPLELMPRDESKPLKISSERSADLHSLCRPFDNVVPLAALALPSLAQDHGSKPLPQRLERSSGPEQALRCSENQTLLQARNAPNALRNAPCQPSRARARCLQIEQLGAHGLDAGGRQGRTLRCRTPERYATVRHCSCRLRG